MNRVVLSLGSNLNPESNILRARLLLAKKFDIVKESSFRKTKPINHPLADEFINGCVYLHTSLNIETLKTELKYLEKEMGRNHQAPPDTAHPIDLDIIVWNEKIVDPRFYKLPFLKDNLLELLPGFKF